MSSSEHTPASDAPLAAADAAPENPHSAADSPPRASTDGLASGSIASGTKHAVVLKAAETHAGAWRAVRAVSECEEMNPSCRNTMEDAHVAIDNFGGSEGHALFAVFDGHGGRGVVEYLAQHFARNLQQELEHEPGSRSVEECITSAYLITDVETMRKGLTVSGSTAVTCLLRREDDGTRALYVANVGDSRAVLASPDAGSWRAERLSVDHKASDAAEVKRIEDAGGFVLRRRVLGILSVTRSFGDHVMKKYVLARPYTRRVALPPQSSSPPSSSRTAAGDAPFLIVACDGVWDVLSDQEAVDLVARRLREGGEDVKESAKGLADALVAESLARGSTDNVTALVVLL